MARVASNYAVIVNGFVVEKVFAYEDFFEIPPTVDGSIRSKYPSFIIVNLDEIYSSTPNVGWSYVDNVFVQPEDLSSQSPEE